MLLVVAWAAMAGALDAPVTGVVVYSDRARVTRTAAVQVSGTQKVELPLLLDSVDADSVRVEVSGAALQRVDLARVPSSEVPSSEAQKLLSELDALELKRAQVAAQLLAHASVLASLQRVSATLPPPAERQPEAKLSSAGWLPAVTFVGARSAQLQARQRELRAKQVELDEERREVAEKARLLGAERGRSGLRVTATVSGSGPAQVALTYVVRSARWYPSYDLQLLPESGKVLVSFSGLVSQESGEDWTDAALTLSTAIPDSSPRPPKLLSWKLGEKERFIPTPVARFETIRPAPPAVALPPVPRDTKEVLLGRLLARTGGVRTAEKTETVDYDPGSTEADSGDALAGANLSKQLAGKDVSRKREAARPAAPPPAAAPERSMQMEERISVVSIGGRSPGAPPEPVAALSLSPPPAYVRPSYGAQLPAALAAGYDLSFDALRKESVKSGGGARRVALLSETWPVSVERKLFPALASEAFLVAEIKSPSAQVLPGGAANLFVGADPSGTAQLKLVAPGEPFTLPLGLDRALRPVRNVKVFTEEKGFIGKQELTRYEVTIELANPYAAPTPVRILDQWPLSADDDVEVKLLSSEPLAIQTQATGALEWRVSLPPRAKTTVKFTYSIRRPKGWQMRQHP